MFEGMTDLSQPGLQAFCLHLDRALRTLEHMADDARDGALALAGEALAEMEERRSSTPFVAMVRGVAVRAEETGVTRW
jgi:hypothetical protein